MTIDRPMAEGKWTHVPLVELIESTGVPLKQQGSDPEGNPGYSGAHATKHASKSGTSLLVWPFLGKFYCTNCKERGDAADWLVDCGKATDRREAEAILLDMYGASPQEWHEPAPFPEFRGPPFPLETLPPPLRRYVKEESEALQVPADLPASLALATVSAVSAGKATVQVKPDWQEALNTYMVAVMDSGERKSPVMRDASAPLEELQRERAKEATSTPWLKNQGNVILGR